MEEDPLETLEKDIMALCMSTAHKIIINIEEVYSIKIDPEKVITPDLLDFEKKTKQPVSVDDTKINHLNCRGKTGSGKQCTRKYKNADSLLCGSHMNKCPYGLFK